MSFRWATGNGMTENRMTPIQRRLWHRLRDLRAPSGGVPADDPKMPAGVAWLKANQRASGRWFTAASGKTATLSEPTGNCLGDSVLVACGEQ